MIIKKIKIESNFLENSLKDSNTLHFLGPENEMSLYINTTEELENIEMKDIKYYFEFLSSSNGPLIVLSFNFDNRLFEFIYNIDEEEDMEELKDLIEYSEAILNIVSYENKELFFLFSYIISPEEDFLQELERIINKAKLEKNKDFSFNEAVKDFNNSRSIMKQKTRNSSDIEFFLMKNEDEELQEENETEEDENDFEYEEDSGFLSIKTYKRSTYENRKKDNNATSKEDELEDEVFRLENLVKKKNKEINLLKRENTYLKEELEYLKLDKTKKNWWKFSKKQ